MTSRLALKGRGAGREGDGAAVPAGGTRGWLAGWAQEVDETAAASSPLDIDAHGAASGEAPAAAAQQQPGPCGPCVLAFAHASRLVTLYQASATEAMVQVSALGAAGAGEPGAAFAVEAAPLLAGGSVPDYAGGPCRPYLLVLAPKGRLRLLLLQPEQRRSAVVWETDPPSQAEVVRQLTSISPGPSVVLPLSTAEVWVACCYCLAAAIPGNRCQQQPPSGWRLYKLRAERAGALLPCALRPCWEGSAAGAAGADSGSHGQRSSSAVAAGGSRAASPPGLHYRLLALASTPFPAAAEPARPGEQQQQQEQQQQELVVAEVVLTPGAHALEAARAHRLPGAGEAVAACLALCKQQGQHSAQLAVATRAGQVCLLPLPAWLAAGWGLGGGEAASTGTDGQAEYHHCGSSSGGRSSDLHACSSSAVAQLPAPADQLYFLPAVARQPGLLLALCGGGDNEGGGCSVQVLSLPGLEIVGRLERQHVSNCIVEASEALLCSLQPGSAGSSGAPVLPAGCGAVALPAAVVLGPSESVQRPALDLGSGASPAYAFLPVAQLALPSVGGGSGTGAAAGGSLAVLHRVNPRPAGAVGAEGEEARRGLLKVVASLQRRVDEGHLEAECMQQLAGQKQRTIAAGEDALARRCRETWGGGASAFSGGGSQANAPEVAERESVEVAGVGLEQRGMGEWRLQVELRGPSSLAERSAALVASSLAAGVSCTHQATRALPPTDGGSAAGRAGLVLTCTLSVQQQAAAAATHCDSLWVDLGVVLGASMHSRGSVVESIWGPPGGSSMHSRGSVVESIWGPPGGSFIPAGRVELVLHPGAQPTSSTWEQQQQQQQQRAGTPGSLDRPWQHQMDLVVQCEGADLGCLLAALEQLAAAPLPLPPAPAARIPEYAQQRRTAYSLPSVLDSGGAGGGGAAGATGGGAVVTWHSAHFAEVAVESDDAALLGRFTAQLERGVRAAARQAGGTASVQGSTLTPQHAHRAAAAAEALLAEVDACTEWVEALLREKAALESAHAASKLPSDVAGLLRAQRVALEAGIATSERLTLLGE